MRKIILYSAVSLDGFIARPDGDIDRLIMTIIPLTIGAGIPLFKDAPGDTLFGLEETTNYKNGIVQLIYSKS